MKNSSINATSNLASQGANNLASQEASKLAIKTTNLTKQYSDVKAVDSLNLEIHSGELFALLGVNGAGKTTTIRMLTGLSTPTSGDAEIYGKNIRKDINDIKKLVGISTQDTAVADNLTVEENLKFMAGIYFSDSDCPDKEQTSKQVNEQASKASGEAKKQASKASGEANEQASKASGEAEKQASKASRRVEEVIKTFKLEEVRSKKAKALSGGWQRKLSIAMAVIGEPKVLFLDEPTLGLDVLARRELWRAVEALKKTTTIILTTHYMEEAEALADRIAIMIKGRLVKIGTLPELEAATGQKGLENVFVSVAEGEEAHHE